MTYVAIVTPTGNAIHSCIKSNLNWSLRSFILQCMLQYDLFIIHGYGLYFVLCITAKQFIKKVYYRWETSLIYKYLHLQMVSFI